MSFCFFLLLNIYIFFYSNVSIFYYEPINLYSNISITLQSLNIFHSSFPSTYCHFYFIRINWNVNMCMNIYICIYTPQVCMHICVRLHTHTVFRMNMVKVIFFPTQDPQLLLTEITTHLCSICILPEIFSAYIQRSKYCPTFVNSFLNIAWRLFYLCLCRSK